MTYYYHDLPIGRVENGKFIVHQYADRGITTLADWMIFLKGMEGIKEESGNPISYEDMVKIILKYSETK